MTPEYSYLRDGSATMEDKESETFAKTQHRNNYISIKVGSKKGSEDATLKFEYLNGRKGKLYQSE